MLNQNLLLGELPMNLICIRHPDYKGTTSPQLSCKTCCGMFLAELRRKNAVAGHEGFDPNAWLDDKVKNARVSAPPKSL